MLDQTNNVPQTASEILGDLTGLAVQLGGTAGLSELSIAASAGSAPINTLPALRRFLDDYVSGVLTPHELPAVARAYAHASRSEVRELIALDNELGQVVALRPFAEASRAVGRIQLRRLRPIRGERVVQRYLHAVETGQANAWHTVVFGLLLALYSLPLRQGLVHFAHQTVGGFIEAADGRVVMSTTDRQQLLTAHAAAVTAATESILAPAAVESD